MTREWYSVAQADGLEVRYEVEAVLYRGRTRFQQVDILRTTAFGAALFLDGDPQSAERDEYLYHEALVHPAMAVHPEPRRVLILGGAEGATLREVLRHNTVEHVVMVDIDDELVRQCQRLLPTYHQGAYADPRLELHCQDAWDYLAATPERFDVVISDLTAPHEAGPSAHLYEERWYRAVREHLATGGVLGLQAQSASPHSQDWHVRIIRMLQNLFSIVRPYQVYVPFYAEPWGFAVASDQQDPLACSPQAIEATLARRGCGQLRLYDGAGHPALFAMPTPLRRALAATP